MAWYEICIFATAKISIAQICASSVHFQLLKKNPHHEKELELKLGNESVCVIHLVYSFSSVQWNKSCALVSKIKSLVSNSMLHRYPLQVNQIGVLYSKFIRLCHKKNHFLTAVKCKKKPQFNCYAMHGFVS